MNDPNNYRNQYTGASPDARVMYGAAIDADHRRLVAETEGLPADVQARLWRLRLTQSVAMMVGLLLFIFLLSLLMWRF